MTEDEFVEYIFSNLRAKGIKPLDWYEDTLRRIWRGYAVYIGNHRQGKMVLLKELDAARDIIEEHYRKDFPEKEEP